VFIADDRFARDFYSDLTGSSHLADSLARRPLVAVDAKRTRNALVFSARGVASGRLTLARFHAPRRCGFEGTVTELVFAFAPGAKAGRGTPPAHVTVVALLESAAFESTSATLPAAPLSRSGALELVTRVAQRAAGAAPLLGPLALDADQAADAGEVIVAGSQYAVGFRARILAAGEDTLLVTGVALTDSTLRHLRWVIKPQRSRLQRGAIADPRVRYSLRGRVVSPGGGSLLLIDEFADVEARNSRATAVEAVTGQVIAAQPLALRCP
jgi:hypothetical protein